MRCLSRAVPCIPLWLALEREADMQIDDRIRKCVAFLGKADGDYFYASGTGFFATLRINNYVFQYFLTARHIVWPGRIMGFSPTPPDNEISIRINRKANKPKIIHTKLSEWIFHDDIKNFDICAYRFSEDEHDPDSDLDSGAIRLQGMSLIRKEEVTDPMEYLLEYGMGAQDYGLSLGDHVFLVGAFVKRVGTHNNIPIVRMGNIAAMPEEPIEFFSPTRPAYLVETRSLGGLSGSPVFLHLFPDRQRGDLRLTGQQSPDGDPTVIMPYMLIGMVLGHHMSSEYLQDFAPREDSKWTDADMKSGLSVAMPVSEIIKFLFLPKLKQEREAAIENRRLATGYKE
jgi:hypothetical protein